MVFKKEGECDRMKKLAMVLAVVIFSLGILVGQSCAADKFAYVDLSRAFSEYGKTKDYEGFNQQRNRI